MVSLQKKYKHKIKVFSLYYQFLISNTTNLKAQGTESSGLLWNLSSPLISSYKLTNCQVNSETGSSQLKNKKESQVLGDIGIHID